MLRRTRLGILLKDGGQEILEPVGTICRQVMHWDDEKWSAEFERYKEIISRYYMVPA